MSIVLNTTPGNYQSVHGDVLFVTYEATKAIDPVTYPNYKYVCDVYINSNLVARQKVFPNPENYRGLFNIGAVVRNYVALQFNPVTGIKAQEFAAGEFKIDVQCKFGEEYDGTLYPDVTTDSTRTYYNHYNGRLVGDNTVLDSYLDLAATNRPAATPIDINANNHFIPYLPSSTSSFDVFIKTYGQDNVLIATQTDSFSATAATNLILFNVGPGAINTDHGALINAGVKYYTVKIGSTSIYQFNLLSNCKYPTYTIHWLNKLGGFESYDFIKKSQKSVTIEKNDYGKLPYVMDASGNINYNTSGGVLYEDRATYSAQFTEKITLNSDWITDNEYAWLKELMLSPLVYIEQSGYYVPIAITGTEYEEKRYIDDKMTNIVLNIEYGARLNAQYR